MLVKGDIVFVTSHTRREDVGNRWPRWMSSGIYKFIHYTNKDTAFVSRLNKTYLGYVMDIECILIPIDTIRKSEVAKCFYRSKR